MALQWNPGNVDRSGEILGAASANAANIRLQGQQMMAQGIGQAADKISDGFTKTMEDYMLKGKVASEVQGMATALKQIGPEYGLDPAMVDNFLADAGKNIDKAHAGLSLLGQHMQQQMKNSWQTQQHQNSIALANHRAGLQQQNAAFSAFLRPPPAAPSPSKVPWGGIQIAPGIDMSR